MVEKSIIFFNLLFIKAGTLKYRLCEIHIWWNASNAVQSEPVFFLPAAFDAVWEFQGSVGLIAE